MKRTATANWQGSGKEGKGHLSTQSTVLNQTQYSFVSRFAEGIGTNPEELIAAAHVGCFTMKLSFVIGEGGFTPGNIDTKCEITFENGAVTKSHLKVTASVPGMDATGFAAAVSNAAANCPISQLLKCEITHEAALV